MKVFPAINCEDFTCVRERVQTAKNILEDGAVVHFDIADGTFTPNISWNNPEELRIILDIFDSRLTVAVHLMVDNPEAIAEKWLKAGAKEVAAHLERLTDRNFFKNVCVQYDAEPVIAVSPETPSRSVLGYADDFKRFLILGVGPGLSGQVFQNEVLDKIREIKWAAPKVVIEVDGGVNPENIGSIKESGADIALSGSYIFNSSDPERAYRDLQNA